MNRLWVVGFQLRLIRDRFLFGREDADQLVILVHVPDPQALGLGFVCLLYTSPSPRDS